MLCQQRVGLLGPRLLRSHVRKNALMTSTRICAPEHDPKTAARSQASGNPIGPAIPTPPTDVIDTPLGKQKVYTPRIRQPIRYLIFFGALSFAGAAFFSQKQGEALTRAPGMLVWRPKDPLSPAGLQRNVEKSYSRVIAKELRLNLERFIRTCLKVGVPESVIMAIGKAYLTVAEEYLSLDAAQQVVVPIIALNTLVFVAWQVASPLAAGKMRSRWGRWMVTHFTHRPTSRRSYTMLTSTFSHANVLHFGLNNFALWTIGGTALILLTRAYEPKPGQDTSPVEVSHTPQFVTFFATAGVFAATVSHIASAVRYRRIRAVRGLAEAVKIVGPQRSLGSSGAIYAALIMSACAMPDAKIQLILLPMFTLPIGVGAAGLVCIDALGVLLRWRVFDHWAHLGGALFGYVYFKCGVQNWKDTLQMVFSIRRYVNGYIEGVSAEADAILARIRLRL